MVSHRYVHRKRYPSESLAWKKPLSLKIMISKSDVNADGSKYRRILRKKPMIHPGLDFNSGSVVSAS